MIGWIAAAVCGLLAAALWGLIIFLEMRNRHAKADYIAFWEEGFKDRRPRVRVLPGGWIRHDGRRFPFNPLTLVETIHHNHTRFEEGHARQAKSWLDSWWTWTSDTPEHDIRFYRIVSAPDHRTAGKVRILEEGERL